MEPVGGVLGDAGEGAGRRGWNRPAARPPPAARPGRPLAEPAGQQRARQSLVAGPASDAGSFPHRPAVTCFPRWA